MKLVELESNQEQLAFLKILTEHPSNQEHHYSYVGAIRPNRIWLWESSMKHITFPLIWHTGAPDNATGNEFCLMAIKRNDEVGVKFDDIECTVNMHVLCEKTFYDNI